MWLGDCLMPLHDNAFELIRRQLEHIARGERVPLIEIGYLTFQQHQHVRELRLRLGLPDVDSATIVYIGHHHYTSRAIPLMTCCVRYALALIQTLKSCCSDA